MHNCRETRPNVSRPPYVSDQIEDLEMPPLAKREKYPALSSAEVALIREWIDVGAPWSPPPAPGNGQSSDVEEEGAQ